MTILTPSAGPAAHPAVAGLSPAGRASLEREARPFHLPPSLFRQEGDHCAAVTLLTTGRVRVAKRRPSGREITLYTFGPGELCVLEVLAVLTRRPYRAEAVVEEPATGLTIAADAFRRLVDDELALRARLFDALETRLALALDLVGDVALESLEARLAGALLRQADGSPEVSVTHERLAQELACAREAVSRTLGTWERAGIVRLGRARVRVLDAGRLASLAARGRALKPADAPAIAPRRRGA